MRQGLGCSPLDPISEHLLLLLLDYLLQLALETLAVSRLADLIISCKFIILPMTDSYQLVRRSF